MKKTIEPFWWTFFSAGGVISALFVPVLLFVLAFALPMGWMSISYAGVSELLRSPISRLFLFLVISLSLLHWSHRFRFTLYDGLQLKHLESLIVVLCYGTAIGLSVFAGIILWTY